MSLDFDLFNEGTQVFSANITHNLNKMATAAGIYGALWHPDESGHTKASDITTMLKEAITDLEANPDFYREFNAENGWGKYEHFLSFVKEVYEACVQYPDSEISVSR